MILRKLRSSSTTSTRWPGALCKFSHASLAAAREATIVNVLPPCGVAFNRERSAVRLHDLARDGEPEAAAAGRGGEIAFDAIEAFEDVGKMLFADADAAIAYAHRDAFVRHPGLR